jgi:short-subunit dehydrogenase
MTKKNIIITGASSGIGKATAIELSDKNVRLVLTSNNASDLKQVAQICINKKAEVVQIISDLSSEAGVDHLVNQCLTLAPEIDTLFLNAGISQRALAENTNTKVLRTIFEVNFFSSVHIAISLLPTIKNCNGHIIVTTSIAGKFGFPLRSAYSASKHALYGYFESLRLENPEIHVSIVCPGRVKTNISHHSLQADGSQYGKMDPGQETGISPEKAAKKIARLINKPKNELLIGGNELLMVHLKRWVPCIFNKIIKRIKPI